MGLYEINCPKCGKAFFWFSGNRCQLCNDCINELGGGVFEIERRYENSTEGLVGCFYFIGYNEAKTYEDAIKLLIERGVPENEIVTIDL